MCLKNLFCEGDCNWILLIIIVLLLLNDCDNDCGCASRGSSCCG